ncbi:hypothetical protein [Vibrio agarivorans]|uniref:hypothetical protein n=1 Tax=Vibrio agarivorans TaxID=153622 RepID=UPI0025B45E25|nr:hypothetical protein [Vibrio agarivorans]MDN3663794.1 hypothetical protein [Vibrio agarivorans]
MEENRVVGPQRQLHTGQWFPTDYGKGLVTYGKTTKSTEPATTVITIMRLFRFYHELLVSATLTPVNALHDNYAKGLKRIGLEPSRQKLRSTWAST